MNISVLLTIIFVLLSPANSFIEVQLCSNATSYQPNTTYESNLRTLLTILSNSSNSLFNSASSTGTGEKIQALYQCRNDISLAQCKSCVSNAVNVVLLKCPIQKTAVTWYDECLVRFSNETIVSVLSTSPKWPITSTNNVPESERAVFTGFVRTDLNDCATAAANSPSKFAFRERDTKLDLNITDRIYSFVQCTADLSNADCGRCLQDVLGNFPSCCSFTIGGRVLMPSCSFRYETYAFFNSSAIASASAPFLPSPSPTNSITATGNPSPRKSGLSTWVIISIAFPIGLLAVIFCIGSFAFIRRRRSSYNIEGSGLMREESLVFHLSRLKAATSNFSSQNLLGHGGYGDVFKGTLENGTEIAVKRLVENSSQGQTEFESEVRLVANLQHKNLTRLLGFCLDGAERILVYEYLHNKSLDHFLFEKGSGQALEWPQRYKIIEGIARGMLYLHEDSRLKIIHRDLKASNILLDGYLNPKISDFGTARICGVDETGVLTYRVIGTRGYMAPEYAIYGTFSVKSDVYSFGVLMLEIITGLKATELRVDDDDEYFNLVDFVCKHWIEKTVTEVVDKRMNEMYSNKEVLRCIHVALLCVEESPLDRPTMAKVVLMLNRESTFVSLVSGSRFSQSKSRSMN